MMSLAEFVFSTISSLIAELIRDKVSLSSVGFYKEKKIKLQIERAIAEVSEPLSDFLAAENISDKKKFILLEICSEELGVLINKPELFFRGSLNGERIFQIIYENRGLPKVIEDEELADVYSLFFPRIASVLSRIPSAIEGWERLAWQDNYRRLDEISVELRNLFGRIDSLINQKGVEEDDAFMILRKTLAQKSAMEIDLTGLRADEPISGSFDDHFVSPLFSLSIPGPNTEAENLECDQVINLLLESKTRILVYGAPGAGKSTWTKWLMRELHALGHNKIIVRIEFRSLVVDDLPSIHQLVRIAGGKHFAEEITSQLVRKWIRDSKLILVFDGFDEVKPSFRQNVKEWILDLSSNIEECSIAITTRYISSDQLNDLKLWRQMDIMPFDKSRVVEYVQRWYASIPLVDENDRKPNASSLADAWDRDPTIAPLTGNPLLLSTLLMVNHLDGKLPSGRALLYKRFIEGMLGIWDNRRNVNAYSSEFTVYFKKEILKSIALFMFLQEKDQLDEGEMLLLIKDVKLRLRLTIGEKEILDILAERTGLLVGPSIYNFSHKSIAEFLVSESVMDGNQKDLSDKRIDRLSLFENRNNDRWKVVIFLWSGLVRVSELKSFINLCLQEGEMLWALSLAYDQFDRLSSEYLCKIILENIEEIDLPEKLGSGGAVHCPFEIKQTSLVTNFDYQLHSLSRQTSLSDLYLMSVRSGVIKWKDFRSVKNSQVLSSISINCLSDTRDIDEWKYWVAQYLDGKFSVFFNEISKQNMQYWIIWRPLFLDLHNGDGDNVLHIMDLSSRLDADCISILPLGLMSLINTMVKWGKIEKCKDLLIATHSIIQKNVHGIDEDWLSGTSEWSAYSSETYDLLKEFERACDVLENNDQVGGKDIILSLREYSMSLLRLRSALGN